MYCTKCGQILNDNVNFCGSCDTPITKPTETAAAIAKTEAHVALATEDEKIKVKYDNKASSVFGKILMAIIISLIVGAITYPISNSILEVDKKDLSWSDYSFQPRTDADNAALRREVLTDKSFQNAKIAAIISFVVVLTFMFIRVENKENKTSPTTKETA